MISRQKRLEIQAYLTRDAAKLDEVFDFNQGAADVQAMVTENDLKSFCLSQREDKRRLQNELKAAASVLEYNGFHDDAARFLKASMSQTVELDGGVS